MACIAAPRPLTSTHAGPCPTPPVRRYARQRLACLDAPPPRISRPANPCPTPPVRRYAGDRRLTGLDASSASWALDEPYSAIAAVLAPPAPGHTALGPRPAGVAAGDVPPSPGRALPAARGNPSVAMALHRLDTERARLQPRQTRPAQAGGGLSLLSCRPACSRGQLSYATTPGGGVPGGPAGGPAGSPPKQNAAITSTQVPPLYPPSLTLLALWDTLVHMRFNQPSPLAPRPSTLVHTRLIQPSPLAPRPSPQGYRHFRFLKTGPNEDEGAGPLLYIATLELYGVLIEAPPTSRPPSPGPEAIPVRPSLTLPVPVVASVSAGAPLAGLPKEQPTILRAPGTPIRV